MISPAMTSLRKVGGVEARCEGGAGDGGGMDFLVV